MWFSGDVFSGNTKVVSNNDIIVAAKKNSRQLLPKYIK